MSLFDSGDDAEVVVSEASLRVEGRLTPPPSDTRGGLGNIFDKHIPTGGQRRLDKRVQPVLPDQLELAAIALDSVGAQRYRDAAERELRQLGEHIHRRSQPGAGDGAGVDVLTQRELEIARRIVDRQTNRQIAGELFLSPKTIETHIRNIFAKLGADSRVEVARIVERADRLAAAKT